jgi:hypothetical protein
MEAESPDDDYKLLKNGKVELIKKTNDNFDRIYNEDKSKSIEVDKGFINKNLISNKESSFVSSNISQAKDAYKFFADNSNVEFSFSIFSRKRDAAVIYSSHEGKSVGGYEFTEKMLNKTGMSLKYHSHSHPGEYNPNTGWPAYPSGFDNNLKITPHAPGDRDVFKSLNKNYPNKIPETFNIYVPGAPNLDVNYDFHDVYRK